MGSSSSRASLSSETREDLTRDYGFTPGQIDFLHERFTILDKDKKGHLTADDLLLQEELRLNPLGKRIVLAIYQYTLDILEEEEAAAAVAAEQRQQRRPYGNISLASVKITFPGFVRAFSRFQPYEKSDEEQKNIQCMRKARFVFRLFDTNRQGEISLEQVMDVFNGLWSDSDEESVLRHAENFMQDVGKGKASINWQDFADNEDIIKWVNHLFIRFWD